MTAGDSRAVVTERRGRVLWIIINRAERRNVLDGAVLAGLHSALATATSESSLRAIVITGAGEKAFCAGADLSQGEAAFGAGFEDPMTEFGRLARAARALEIPLIARINGACVAGGMGLLSLCDLAIAADHARFGLPEAKVGVFPMQVMVYLRRMIAPRDLNWLCFTGQLIDAARAQAMDLVNEVVPMAQLDARIDELSEQIALTSPTAVRRGKYAMAAMESMSFDAALAFAEGQITIASRTGDAIEGRAAFEGKRAPDWVARSDGDSDDD